MKLKEFGCNIKAIPFYMRTGVWIPHLYEEIETHKGIIIADETSFRESESLQHTENEKVYTDATITTMRCVYCGKELKDWYNREPIRI